MDNLTLAGNHLQLSGAKKVSSCTQSQAVIETNDKRILISGTELEVKKLNLENGEVELCGEFSNIKILGSQEKKSLLKRIFK